MGMNERLIAIQRILDRIDDAKREAQRFIQKCDEAMAAYVEDRGDTGYCAAYAAAKRSSLDLTRALSYMRNGGKR